MYKNILHPLRLEELAKTWILEDTSSFDFSAVAVEEQETEFDIFMEASGVLAGIPFANAVFAQLGLTPYWFYSDGDRIASETEIARISGFANKLLLAECIVPNVLSRASGVATTTSKIVERLKNIGWKGVLAGTRETTPGFRMVEKYALLIGGADMLGCDSSSTIVLKSNLISVAGSIEKAIEKVREVSGISLKIAVECKSLNDAVSAGKTSCDIVILDNFKPEDAAQSALTLKLQYPSILIEASGGITEQNVEDYVCPWIDVISSSNLVKGYPTIDFSMKVRNQTITLDE